MSIIYCARIADNDGTYEMCEYSPANHSFSFNGDVAAYIHQNVDFESLGLQLFADNGANIDIMRVDGLKDISNIHTLYEGPRPVEVWFAAENAALMCDPRSAAEIAANYSRDEIAAACADSIICEDEWQMISGLYACEEWQDIIFPEMIPYAAAIIREAFTDDGDAAPYTPEQLARALILYTARELA